MSAGLRVELSEGQIHISASKRKDQIEEICSPLDFKLYFKGYLKKQRKYGTAFEGT